MKHITIIAGCRIFGLAAAKGGRWFGVRNGVTFEATTFERLIEIMRLI